MGKNPMDKVTERRRMIRKSERQVQKDKEINNLAKGGDNNRIAIYKNVKWLMENKKLVLANHSRLILQLQQPSSRRLLS